MYVSGAIRLLESLQQNNHNINQSKRIEECKLQRQVNSEVNNVFFFNPILTLLPSDKFLKWYENKPILKSN